MVPSANNDVPGGRGKDVLDRAVSVQGSIASGAGRGGAEQFTCWEDWVGPRVHTPGRTAASCPGRSRRPAATPPPARPQPRTETAPAPAAASCCLSSSGHFTFTSCMYFRTGEHCCRQCCCSACRAVSTSARQVTILPFLPVSLTGSAKPWGMFSEFVDEKHFQLLRAV